MLDLLCFCILFSFMFSVRVCCDGGKIAMSFPLCRRLYSRAWSKDYYLYFSFRARDGFHAFMFLIMFHLKILWLEFCTDKVAVDPMNCSREIPFRLFI